MYEKGYGVERESDAVRKMQGCRDMDLVVKYGDG